MASTMRFDRWEDSTGNLISDGVVARGLMTATAGGTNGKSIWTLPNNIAISTSTTADIPGASMTFNAVAGRTYRATINGYLDASNGSRYQLFITDSSNNVKRTYQDQANTVWGRNSFTHHYYFTGTGSTTLKLRLSSTDNQTIYMYGTYADVTLNFVIEDIGPA
jgi:hypothetical protein